LKKRHPVGLFAAQSRSAPESQLLPEKGIDLQHLHKLVNNRSTATPDLTQIKHSSPRPQKTFPLYAISSAHRQKSRGGAIFAKKVKIVTLVALAASKRTYIGTRCLYQVISRRGPSIGGQNWNFQKTPDKGIDLEHVRNLANDTNRRLCG